MTLERLFSNSGKKHVKEHEGVKVLKDMRLGTIKIIPNNDRAQWSSSTIYFTCAANDE